MVLEHAFDNRYVSSRAIFSGVSTPIRPKGFCSDEGQDPIPHEGSGKELEIIRNANPSGFLSATAFLSRRPNEVWIHIASRHSMRWTRFGCDLS